MHIYITHTHTRNLRPMTIVGHPQQVCRPYLFVGLGFSVQGLGKYVAPCACPCLQFIFILGSTRICREYSTNRVKYKSWVCSRDLSRQTAGGRGGGPHCEGLNLRVHWHLRYSQYLRMQSQFANKRQYE